MLKQKLALPVFWYCNLCLNILILVITICPFFAITCHTFNRFIHFEVPEFIFCFADVSITVKNVAFDLLWKVNYTSVSGKEFLEFAHSINVNVSILNGSI